ncbi:MAG TPA: DUF948 domain-containing protein [Vicinamibacterales bacterium]|nr:DUF948 domain-containing protein [Vicinamibacterales bacterium]
MTDVWLGVIAVAVLVMAVTQVAVLIRLSQVAKEAAAATQDLRRDLAPLIEKVHRIADDATRVSALALAQVERLDLAVNSTVRRIDETITTVQHAIINPVRQGAAVMSGLKAAMAVFRARQDRGRYHRDDEDALFIG